MRKYRLALAAALIAVTGSASAQQSAIKLQIDNLTFCFGHDDVINQCVLFIGSATACANITPCLDPVFDPGLTSPAVLFEAVDGKAGQCTARLVNAEPNETYAMAEDPEAQRRATCRLPLR